MRRAPLLASAFLPGILCSSRAPCKAYTHLTSTPGKSPLPGLCLALPLSWLSEDNRTFASLCELSASWEMRCEQGLLDSRTNAMSYCSPGSQSKLLETKGEENWNPTLSPRTPGSPPGKFSGEWRAGKLWIQSVPRSRDASSSPHARNRVIPKAYKLAMVSRSHEG